MNNKISHNYFSGETNIPITVTLGEAEVMYSASDDIKKFAESGELKNLHDKCA